MVAHLYDSPVVSPDAHPEPSNFVAKPPTSIVERVRAKNRARKLPTITLPISEIEVRYKRKDFNDLMAMGLLPQTLTQAVEQAVQQSDATLEGGVSFNMNLATSEIIRTSGITELGKSAIDLRKAWCILGAVSPRIVATTDDIRDPEIDLPVNELDEEDQEALANAIQGEYANVAAVAPFPQSGLSAGTGPTGDAVSPPAIPTSEPLSEQPTGLRP